MYNIKELFDDIVIIADTLEENDIDNYKFPKGISHDEINHWEKENDAILPEGYKSFLLLANGFHNHGTEIYSLDRITRLDFPDDYKGYFAIGSYIGDGTFIFTDNKGNFCCGDHINGVHESTFEEFVEKWILEDMKDSLEEHGLKMPKKLKTNKQKLKPILSDERFLEIMAKIKADSMEEQ